ncbi:VOC family protein [Enterobacter vonholyi]
MKKNIIYEFHHFGIPVNDGKVAGIYSEKAGMYTEDNPGAFRVQWHRFEPESTLHLLIRTVPHIAFKVSDLQEAIRDEDVILGPYEPIDGFLVAMINDAGVPIEFIETELTDDEVWLRARSGQGSLYRK